MDETCMYIQLVNDFIPPIDESKASCMKVFLYNQEAATFAKATTEVDLTINVLRFYFVLIRLSLN